MRNLKLLFLLPLISLSGCADLKADPNEINEITYVVGNNKESVITLDLVHGFAWHKYVTMLRCATLIDSNIQACGPGSTSTYTLQSNFTANKKDEFIKDLWDYGVFEMESSYLLPDETKQNKNYWSITIEYANGGIKKSEGASQSPETTITYFKKAITKLTEFTSF